MTPPPQNTRPVAPYIGGKRALARRICAVIDADDLIVTSARAVSMQVLLDFAPQGYTQIANTEAAGEVATRRTVWIEGPTTALGDLALTVQAPVPFNGSNGGGALRIVFEPV